jgi:hypothetical protein
MTNNFLFFDSTRSSGLVGKHSTNWTMPPALFAVVIFLVGFHIFTLAGLDLSPPNYVSCVNRDDKCIPLRSAFYWLRWSLANSLPGIISNSDPSYPSLPNGWDYRCETQHQVLNIFICVLVRLIIPFESIVCIVKH